MSARDSPSDPLEADTRKRVHGGQAIGADASASLAKAGRRECIRLGLAGDCRKGRLCPGCDGMPVGCSSNGTADCQSTAASERCAACPHGESLEEICTLTAAEWQSEAERAEAYIANMIDRGPEPLRRLADWLAHRLDEDDWKTAERMLLGAYEACSVSAADAARYRYIVGVYGFTLAEDLFGITTGRNVSVQLDEAIDENIEAHKQWERT